jgi:hypothetical protein
VTQAAPAVSKAPTKSPQPARGTPGRPAARAKACRPAPGRVRASGAGRAATRGGGEVIELEHGITVYPARGEHGRWRAVWHEDGERQQCEAASEEKLAARLEKVTKRLAAGAPDMNSANAPTDGLRSTHPQLRQLADTEPDIGLPTRVRGALCPHAGTPGEGEINESRGSQRCHRGRARR